MKSIGKCILIIVFSFCFKFSFSQKAIVEHPISIYDLLCKQISTIGDINLRALLMDVCKNGWINITDKSETPFNRTNDQFNLLVEVKTGPIVLKDQLSIVAKFGIYSVLMHNVGGDIWSGVISEVPLKEFSCSRNIGITYHVTGFAKSSLSENPVPIDKQVTVYDDLGGYGKMVFDGLNSDDMPGYYIIENEIAYDVNYRLGTIEIINALGPDFPPYTISSCEAYTQDSNNNWIINNDIFKIVNKPVLPLTLPCGSSVSIQLVYRDTPSQTMFLIINDMFFFRILPHSYMAIPGG